MPSSKRRRDPPHRLKLWGFSDRYAGSKVAVDELIEVAQLGKRSLNFPDDICAVGFNISVPMGSVFFMKPANQTSC
jgi:hypothetical protein